MFRPKALANTPGFGSEEYAEVWRATKVAWQNFLDARQALDKAHMASDPDKIAAATAVYESAHAEYERQGAIDVALRLKEEQGR